MSANPMSPDKEHAPALMQQAADEAVARAVSASTAVWDSWPGPIGLSNVGEVRTAAMTAALATLTAQLAAAEAKVAVAAEDERDRLYDMAMEEASVTRNGTKRRERAAWAAEWLRLNGSGSRAALRALTQEPSNAE